MYPHERSLVASHAGKPFVFLGVNSDEDPQALKQAMTRERLTWRTWMDGSTTGPIATAWQVQSWPTIYVLDDKGVIRFKRIAAQQLDEAVESLLREMEREKHS
jgi:hypothetical protein